MSVDPLTQIFDKNHQHIEDAIPEIIQKRMTTITEIAFKAMLDMGINLDISSQVSILYNFNDIVPDPRVNMKKGKITLQIPLLYLISSEDLKTPVYEWFKKQIEKKTDLTQKDVLFINACFKFLENPKLSQKAKKFVLYHEIAHISNGDISSKPKSDQESKDRERKADMKAAEFSKAKEGAVYLFKIMSEFSVRNQKTHPSFLERIKYLENCKF
ncbi:MAG: hypothetical protein KDK55_04625 [Chlamydiia bacterium]|nr:hypothetical protein [Chlamydiia bacterium]